MPPVISDLTARSEYKRMVTGVERHLGLQTSCGRNCFQIFPRNIFVFQNTLRSSPYSIPSPEPEPEPSFPRSQF